MNQYFIHPLFGDEVIYRFPKNELYGSFFDKKGYWNQAERFGANNSSFIRISRDKARKLFPKAFKN